MATTPRGQHKGVTGLRQRPCLAGELHGQLWGDCCCQHGLQGILVIWSGTKGLPHMLVRSKGLLCHLISVSSAVRCQGPLGSEQGGLLLSGRQSESSSHISGGATTLCNDHAWPRGTSLEP